MPRIRARSFIILEFKDRHFFLIPNFVGYGVAYGVVFRAVDPRLLALLARQRRSILLGLACAGGVAGLTLLTIAFVRWVIGAVLALDTRALAFYALGVVALYGLKYFFNRGQTYYLMRAAHRLTADLRKEIFAKLHSLPLSFFNESRVGALESVLTQDVGLLQNGVLLARDLVIAPLLVIGGIAGLFLLSWKLALVSLVALPFVAWAIRQSARRVLRAQERVQEELGNMNAMMQESLNNIRLVKSFSAEEREVQRFEDHIERTFTSNMRVVARMASLRPLIEFIGAVAVALVIWVGGTLVAHTEMQPQDLLAFALALDYIVRGATGVGNLANVHSQMKAALHRIYDGLLNIREESRERKSGRVLAQVEGRIEFRDVSFVYPDGTRALQGVSFTMEPGTCTALVGKSGAGKTTLADLLLRFFDPTSGHIYFDGVEVRELATDWLRKQIGVVSQQTLLFAATIRENIAFGKPDATQEEIERAARLAHAHEFIQAMPNGYETLLGEKGVRLSGGEMQRIAIARALLVNPTVLILDEATSALDAMSERKVQEALEEAMAHRTTLMIAHRITTAARADQILVLSHGEIIERGTHSELLGRGGVYAAMFRAFSAGVMEETPG
ncbi:MAG: ABC transporter ATP-binding protein/permease [Fimbriimonadales bacterium]|nr:ABC transporter ATP-binding protein/permease [Fimbriimonadales bacterium]